MPALPAQLFLACSLPAGLPFPIHTPASPLTCPGRFCHRKLRDFQAAATAYGRLLDLGHRSVKTFNARAYCFASLGRYAAAVADYDEVIRRDPANAHAYHNRRGVGGGAVAHLGGRGCAAEGWELGTGLLRSCQAGYWHACLTDRTFGTCGR